MERDEQYAEVSYGQQSVMDLQLTCSLFITYLNHVVNYFPQTRTLSTLLNIASIQDIILTTQVSTLSTTGRCVLSPQLPILNAELSILNSQPHILSLNWLG